MGWLVGVQLGRWCRAVRGWCLVGELEADVVLVRLLVVLYVASVLRLPNAEVVRWVVVLLENQVALKFSNVNLHPPYL